MDFEVLLRDVWYRCVKIREGIFVGKNELGEIKCI